MPRKHDVQIFYSHEHDTLAYDHQLKSDCLNGLGPWMYTIAEFYHPKNWTFRVDNKGKYLPGEHKLPIPDDFVVNTLTGLKFRIKSKSPHGHDLPHRELELRTQYHTIMQICCRIVRVFNSLSKARKFIDTHTAHNLFTYTFTKNM